MITAKKLFRQLKVSSNKLENIVYESWIIKKKPKDKLANRKLNQKYPNLIFSKNIFIILIKKRTDKIKRNAKSAIKIQ